MMCQRMNRNRLKSKQQVFSEQLEPRSYLSVTFSDPTYVLNIRGVTAIAAANVSGNGQPDLVVTGLSPSSVNSAIVGVYPNQSGHFITPSAYTVGSEAGGLAVGDFLGNGAEDIATVDPSDNQLYVLLNNGSGTFTSAAGAALGGSGGDTTVVAADFNGDGKEDIAVADPNDNQVVIAFSNGDGSFTVGTPISIPDPETIVAADFSGDGHPDLAILSGQSPTTVYIALNLGNGTFAAPVAYSFGSTVSSINSIAAASFTGSGKPDLVGIGSSTTGTGVAAVLLNQGAGTFGTASDLALPDAADAVVTGDFSGSGHIDIAAFGQSGSLDILPGNGDGTFGSDQSVFTNQLGTPGNQAVSADFDGNGTPDIAFLSRSQGGVGVVLNGVSTSVLTPTLTGKLPTKALVSGGKITAITQELSFTASSAFSGSATVNLELFPVGTFDSSFSTIATLTKKLKLKAGRTQRFPLAIRSLPSGLAGSYYLFAQLTDSTGAVSIGTVVQPLTIVPPTIDLSGSVISIPRSGKAGRKAIVRFKVSNSGTITAASAALPVDIFSSTTGTLDSTAVNIDDFTRRVAIAPGRTVVMQASVTLPSTPGTYYLVVEVDPQNTLHDVDFSNNVFSSVTTIAIS